MRCIPLSKTIVPKHPTTIPTQAWIPVWIRQRRREKHTSPPKKSTPRTCWTSNTSRRSSSRSSSLLFRIKKLWERLAARVPSPKQRGKCTARSRWQRAATASTSSRSQRRRLGTNWTTTRKSKNSTVSKTLMSSIERATLSRTTNTCSRRTQTAILNPRPS